MKKCFKEWNAVIEALGQGIQTVLIRKYKTNADKFLLYPTVSYAQKDGYLSLFQEKYEDFVINNALPKIDGNNVEIKYLVSVEKNIKVTSRNAASLSNYYIWNKDHVSSYLEKKNGYIWLLRTYKLEKPILASAKKAAMTFAELDRDVSLEGLKPVLSNENFEKIINKL